RDDSRAGLVVDEVSWPRVLAVVEAALPVLRAVLEVEDPGARFDDGDGEAGLQFCELLREHRSRDAAADDADVGFVDHRRAGGLSDPGSPRQLSRSIAAP